MIMGLCDAETKYFREIRRTVVDINSALKMNHLYSDRLFELYGTLKDSEEKAEIEYEIDYLVGQAKALRKIQSMEELR